MLQNVPSADSALERRTAQTEAFWKNCSPGHQRFRKAFENKIYIRPQKRLKIVKVLAMVRLRMLSNDFSCRACRNMVHYKCTKNKRNARYIREVSCLKAAHLTKNLKAREGIVE